MSTQRDSRPSVLSQYFNEIREIPLLTKEEEKQLARDIQKGSREALNELVESNLSFVAKVASEHGGTVTFNTEEGKGTNFRVVIPDRTS